MKILKNVLKLLLFLVLLLIVGYLVHCFHYC